MTGILHTCGTYTYKALPLILELNNAGEDIGNFVAALYGGKKLVIDGVKLLAKNGPGLVEKLGFFKPKNVDIHKPVKQLSIFNQEAKYLSKDGKQNIRILRNWAKSKGWVKFPGDGPEIWGRYGDNGKEVWHLKIKPQSSRGERDFPRFDARVGQIRIKGQDKNNYINPFTGKMGPSKQIGTHIHLETLEPMLSRNILTIKAEESTILIRSIEYTP